MPPGQIQSEQLNEQAQDARRRIAHRLVELQTVLLALSDESRSLKLLTTAGHPLAEISIATETLEQFLGLSGAFAENMHKRFEARMGLLRRGEPAQGGRPNTPAGHGAFWMAFSRLGSVLRRLERHVGG
jgi:hypothetical protein